jgi:hypothetical protein
MLVVEYHTFLAQERLARFLANHFAVLRFLRWRKLAYDLWIAIAG